MLEEKYESFAEYEQYGTSARKLADKFEVGKTQVTDLLQTRKELKILLEKEISDSHQKRKIRKTERLAIDQMVYNWFCNASNNNVQFSDYLIKMKALEMSENLKIGGFKASNGWLYKFKKRHNISWKRVYGKSIQIKRQQRKQPNLKIPT